MLARSVPEARVLVAHGQMRERELEDRMLRFMHGEADVLLCTTIIESGLDIPRANTILINRADALGLDGTETFDIEGLSAGAKSVTVKATKESGETTEFEARVRIDTPKEWDYYQNGGILHYVLRQLATAA